MNTICPLAKELSPLALRLFSESLKKHPHYLGPFSITWFITEGIRSADFEVEELPSFLQTLYKVLSIFRLPFVLGSAGFSFYMSFLERHLDKEASNLDTLSWMALGILASTQTYRLYCEDYNQDYNIRRT